MARIFRLGRWAEVMVLGCETLFVTVSIGRYGEQYGFELGIDFSNREWSLDKLARGWYSTIKFGRW
jgi:hypothetical protein